MSCRTINQLRISNWKNANLAQHSLIVLSSDRNLFFYLMRSLDLTASSNGACRLSAFQWNSDHGFNIPCSSAPLISRAHINESWHWRLDSRQLECQVFVAAWTGANVVQPQPRGTWESLLKKEGKAGWGLEGGWGWGMGARKKDKVVSEGHRKRDICRKPLVSERRIWIRSDLFRGSDHYREIPNCRVFFCKLWKYKCDAWTGNGSLLQPARQLV